MCSLLRRLFDDRPVERLIEGTDKNADTFTGLALLMWQDGKFAGKTLNLGDFQSFERFNGCDKNVSFKSSISKMMHSSVLYRLASTVVETFSPFSDLLDR